MSRTAKLQVRFLKGENLKFAHVMLLLRTWDFCLEEQVENIRLYRQLDTQRPIRLTVTGKWIDDGDSQRLRMMVKTLLALDA